MYSIADVINPASSFSRGESSSSKSASVKSGFDQVLQSERARATPERNSPAPEKSSRENTAAERRDRPKPPDREETRGSAPRDTREPRPEDDNSKVATDANKDAAPQDKATETPANELAESDVEAAAESVTAGASGLVTGEFASNADDTDIDDTSALADFWRPLAEFHERVSQQQTVSDELDVEAPAEATSLAAAYFSFRQTHADISTETGVSDGAESDLLLAGKNNTMRTEWKPAMATQPSADDLADDSVKPGTQSAATVAPLQTGKSKPETTEKIQFASQLESSAELASRPPTHMGITPAANTSAQLQQTAAADSARLHMPVNVTFGKTEWAGAVAEKTAMMAAQNINSADLQLDPPELGPLQVRVQVHHDQVHVSFISANPNVRDALDQTAMRLRDLCEQQGMNLVNVDVSDNPQQQSAFAHQSSGSGPTADADDETLPATDPAPVSANLQAAWGIDSYA